MTRKALFVAIAAVLSISTGALAQQAGTYSGTSADGGGMSMTVTESGGVFTVTSASVNFIAACDIPGNSVSEGWGFSLNQQLINGAADFASSDDYYDIFGSLRFVGSHTIKGMITSLTATFAPGHTPPTKSQFCKSPKQAFTLTKQPAAELSPIAPGTAVVLHQSAQPK